MLQILSTSNETSTGPELVQNGDFSELGADLVTNGDFSAAGSNLVTNSNFTDTGSELVLNNDFSSSSSHWSHQNNSTISVGTHEGRSDVADINITGTSTADRIEQSFTYVNGKSYKVTIEVYVVSGSFRIDSRDTFVTTDFLSTTTTGEWQTLTAYITAIQSGTDVIWLRSKVPGEVSQFYVDSVSIKELGEDWAAYTSGTSTVEYNSTGANLLIDSAANGGSNVGVYQENIFELGKSYKIVLSMKATASFDAEVVESNLAATENVIGTVSLTTSFQDFTFYYVGTGTFDLFIHRLYNGGGASQTISIQSVVVQELGEDWASPDGNIDTYNENGVTITSINADNDNRLSQISVTEDGKSYKVIYTIHDTSYSSGTVFQYFDGDNYISFPEQGVGTHTFYFTRVGADDFWNFNLNASSSGSLTDFVTISSLVVQELGEGWTLGTGWSIGADKAISTVTGLNSDITQSILTAGKTYRTVYEIVDYDAGTAQAIVTGSDGADAVALGTYTEDLTTTGTDFSIRSKLGNFDGAVSSVSVKQLGTYEDQSIYVTAADVQTLPQASVYYLVELTSMASKNSIYFLPSSVVPNNGRYTKLNFTVVSKDALPTPASGIISFYDSVGGFDTYPMGFYEFRIYEQTSSTNLDPTLATGLLEKGFAFVRDFSGNMQELTDGFKEYNPTLTQYVYSK